VNNYYDTETVLTSALIGIEEKLLLPWPCIFMVTGVGVGLDLDLKDHWRCPWPWLRRQMASALYLLSSNLSLNADRLSNSPRTRR